MQKIDTIGLSDVQAVYSGPEGDLWELIMGEQIHIGGFQSSMDLANKAGIGQGLIEDPGPGARVAAGGKAPGPAGKHAHPRSCPPWATRGASPRAARRTA